MITVRGLSKKFKAFEAVKRISFEAREGEVLGLLGENGAGKTTTLRMLATMLKPTEGTAEINGFDLLKQPDRVRGEIGILFGGEVGIYDRLTARENIRYFAELNNMEDSAIDKRIDELADMLDMKDYIDKRVGKFSRGMKQKVSIARAIVHNPKVMLFDEPTSGLDVTSTRIIHEFIEDCRKQGKIIIFSSHTMSEVEKLCDRIVIIHKGVIVADGDIPTLRKHFNNEDLEDVFIELVGGKR
ncbi:MAG: ATP-binding cassette domain-containing protein [Clostridiales bacterium]|nr:ATP-binding cassette domain-containing protein [Clostridiales bacterium]